MPASHPAPGGNDLVRAVSTCMQDSIIRFHAGTPLSVFGLMTPRPPSDDLRRAFEEDCKHDGPEPPHPALETMLVPRLSPDLLDAYRTVRGVHFTPHHLGGTILLARALDADQTLLWKLRMKEPVIAIVAGADAEVEALGAAAQRGLLPGVQGTMQVLTEPEVAEWHLGQAPGLRTGVVLTSSGYIDPTWLVRRLGQAMTVPGPLAVVCGRELPSEVAGVADGILRIPRLDGRTVAEVVAMTLFVSRHDPLEEIGSEDCSALLLDDLRLVIRPGGTVTETLERLRALLAMRRGVASEDAPG